jgi:integrase
VQHYGRKELTFSLGTSNHREACEKARAEAHRLDLEFAQVRERLAAGAAAQPTPQLTQAKAQELAVRWLHEALAAAEEARANATRPTTEEALEAHEEALGHLESDAAERLATRNYGVALQEAKELLEAEGLSLHAHPSDYSLLARELLKARIQGLRIEQRRTWGDYSDPVLAPVASTLGSSGHASIGPSPAAGGLRLDEALEKYIGCKAAKWAVGSARGIIPDLKDFVALVSVDPQNYREAAQPIFATALDRDRMRQYHKIMHHLPKRRSVSAPYKGKTLAELMAMDIPEENKLGASTLGQAFTYIRGFVNWLEEERLLDRNWPASSLNKVLEVHRKASDISPTAFTDEELALLFHPDHFKPDTFRASWCFWLPLLGLHTGARLEELCQLHLADIRRESGSGVWFLDINDQGDKHLKTSAGRRMVPIHPALVELGLLDRVKALRAKGKDRLFPGLEIRPSTGNLSGRVGQWFTRYRRNCGVGGAGGEKSAKVFHSFRHTLITRAKFLGLDRRAVKELVGHEKDEFSDVTGRYEGAFPVQHLYDAVILKLDFGAVVDLERLKGCFWVHKS